MSTLTVDKGSMPVPYAAVSTVVVVFTVHEGALRVRLVPGPAGRWVLPGGYTPLVAEDLDAGARRLLTEQTGLDDVYLEQLYTFARAHADPGERAVTVAYFGPVPPRAAGDLAATGWHQVEDLPPLAGREGEVIARARRRLQAKLTYSTLGFHFMPAEFTLGELQNTYETIRGEPLDKRNFRKWVRGLGCVEETGGVRREGAHRPARLHRFLHPGRVEIIK